MHLCVAGGGVKYEGFYREMELASNEHPSIHDAVGKLDIQDKPALLDYLEHGKAIVVTAGWVGDVIDPTIDKATGQGFLTDGEWIWPIELEYYVEKYDLAVSDEFIEHAASRQWAVPELTVEELMELADGFFAVGEDPV